jgi:serine/threonine protein kinase
VALKFVNKRVHFEQEIRIRKRVNLDPRYVINIIGSLDSDEDEGILEEFHRKGLADYPYCIIMPAGDRNLGAIMSDECVDDDLESIRKIAIDITKAVSHLHSLGICHGDIKPQNIMRVQNHVKLIDLDASSKISEEYSAVKYSSAYLPPEFICTVDGNYIVKSYKPEDESSDLPYKPIISHPSQDIWALGLVFYELVTGVQAFLANKNDNIVDKGVYAKLHDFTEYFKKSVLLSRVKDPNIKNLISQMLNKDPLKRPYAQQIIAHPYFSGNKATRMIGDEPEFDIFISYRVASDASHAQILYEKLQDVGFLVWWDKMCLAPGVPWEIGFCDGLVKSKLFMPLLSRGAINHPSNARQNYMSLTASSPCDNVLLEHWLALEMKERGFTEKIFPILIGALDQTIHRCFQF